MNPIKKTDILFENANEPKLFYCIEGATHYEVYEGVPFETTLQKLLDNLMLSKANMDSGGGFFSQRIMTCEGQEYVDRWNT